MIIFYDVIVLDSEGNTNKYGMVQYMFEGPEIEIKVKPHGNSKKKLFLSLPLLPRDHIQELATKSTCKDIVTNEQGGEIGSKLLIFDKLLQSQKTRMCCTASCLSAN